MSTFTQLSQEKLNYIEQTGLLLEKFGLTRMAGRVFGLLSVLDVEALSFDEIREILGASKGSISSTVKLLQQVNFVEAVSYPGDRKTYFRMNSLNIGEMLKIRIQMFGTLSAHLDKALSIKEKNDDQLSVWLNETSTFYNWLQTEISQVINKWETEKKHVLSKKTERKH
jgi:DNA-binding transcriptional regulator GbsR (MarR family)